MTSNNTSIRPVKNKADLNKFIRFPWKIYKGNSHWVPPLIKDVKFKLDRKKHPFFENARMELFIAERGNEILGRIVAIINERYNEFHKEQLGFFGMFECVDDVETARLLFNAAEDWCRLEGMQQILGPVNLSTNDECGFLLEGFELDPAILMPYTPNYYLELSEECGYKKAKDLYAYLKTDVGVVDRIEKIVERVKSKEDIVVRPLDMKNYFKEVELIKDIYNAAWELNWGFVPMTPAEMDVMAKELKPIIEPELVLFAEVKGEPVGISVTLPDMNFVLKKLNGKFGPLQLLKFFYYKGKVKGLRNIIFGLKKEYRLTGISYVLYYETELRGAKIGFESCEMSWNLEDNKMITRFNDTIGGKLYKKYRLYEKDLTNLDL
jgi:GNAT superfamily N-acetyltransferase